MKSRVVGTVASFDAQICCSHRLGNGTGASFIADGTAHLVDTAVLAVDCCDNNTQIVIILNRRLFLVLDKTTHGTKFRLSSRPVIPLCCGDIHGSRFLKRNKRNPLDLPWCTDNSPIGTLHNMISGLLPVNSKL